MFFDALWAHRGLIGGLIGWPLRGLLGIPGAAPSLWGGAHRGLIRIRGAPIGGLIGGSSGELFFAGILHCCFFYRFGVAGLPISISLRIGTLTQPSRLLRSIMGQFKGWGKRPKKHDRGKGLGEAPKLA